MFFIIIGEDPDITGLALIGPKAGHMSLSLRFGSNVVIAVVKVLGKKSLYRFGCQTIEKQSPCLLEC